jgi:hypothetical protein
VAELTQSHGKRSGVRDVAIDEEHVPTLRPRGKAPVDG